ncbi:MAG: CHAP domain-containing protein, partial [Chloroflexi bacterium]
MVRPILLVLLFVFTISPLLTASSSAPAALQNYTLTLAGTIVEVALPIAAPEFVQSAPADAIQIATAANWDPFLEISLSAEPVASTLLAPGAPSRFAASPNELKQSLQGLRTEQNATALPTHKIQLFDQAVESTSHIVYLYLREDVKEPVIIHEWVGQANQQNWTFRVSYTPDQVFDDALLDQIEIRVTGTSLLASPEAAAPAPSAAEESSAELLAASILPAPNWWQGDECDNTHYLKYAGRRSYPLGASYRGIKACGPRPVYDSATDVRVAFYEGAHGALEWECVELSMRFLWLAYQVPPYSGNGKDVVNNYQGSRLVKIKNDTPGKAPQPGNILSYGTTSAWGHTSVVSASDVDSSGNGSITIIEQNWSMYGTQKLEVKNWHVYAAMLITGWLHDPYVFVLTSPENYALFGRYDSVMLTWGSVIDAKNYTIELTGGPGMEESVTFTGRSIVLAAGAPGGVYKWRVWAHTSAGKTEESMLRTFSRKYG